MATATTLHHPANLAAFDKLLAEHPFVIVDFYADWCPPCKMIAPLFEQLANYNGDNIAFAKVNTDYAQDIAMRYDVTAMPTFIFFKDGKPEGNPIQGAIPPVLMKFTGIFAQMARERKEAAAKFAKMQADAEGKSDSESEEAGAKDENVKDEGVTVSGGYTMGAESGKRSDWRMSLHA